MSVQARLTLAAVLLTFTACEKNSSETVTPVIDTSSAGQMRSATYASEYQRKALSGFIKGSEFCEKYKDITSKENGFSVTVPVDYADITKGTTQVWAYFTSGPYDATKPTMIYFDGGSGGNSHGQEKYLNNYNELHYDQRGIGCSHPESFELYRDVAFYSNENNAKDANEIRKALKIEKVSVYGASYGTIVATVYASLFGENTTAAILDGTTFSNDDNYKIIGFYLKKMYATLPEGTKLGLKKYINSTDQVARLWMLARVLMYSNDPFTKLKIYLQKAFPSENEIDQALADRLLGPGLFESVFFGDDIGSVEGFNNKVLNCKNMSHKNEIVASLFGPYNGVYHELTDYKETSDMTQECAAIGVFQRNQKTYQGDQYPISVPVTYFQGNLDGATFASDAIQHYKKVPLKQKQLLIALNAGHCPGQSAIASKNQMAVEIVESALAGKLITSDQLKRLNDSTTANHWTYATPKQLP